MGSSRYLELCICVLILYISCSATVLCIENSKDQHLRAFDDLHDWWKESRTTKDPLDWIRDWEQRWKKYTFAPPPKIKTRDKFEDFFKRKENKSEVLWIAGFIVFILVTCFCAILKYYCEENAGNSRTSLYNELAAVRSRQRSNSQRSPLPTISRSNTSETQHIVVEFTDMSTNSNISNSAVDQPPRYDIVVQDSLNGKVKFPEVQTFESPPPKYEEYNQKRY